MTAPQSPPAAPEGHYARVEIQRVKGGFVATYYGPDGDRQAELDRRAGATLVLPRGGSHERHGSLNGGSARTAEGPRPFFDHAGAVRRSGARCRALNPEVRKSDAHRPALSRRAA